MSKKEKMKHIIDLSASIEETKKAKTVLFYSTAAVAECPLAAGRLLGLRWRQFVLLLLRSDSQQPQPHLLKLEYKIKLPLCLATLQPLNITIKYILHSNLPPY